MLNKACGLQWSVQTHMEVPVDYTDSEDTSSDSADQSEFVRPVLLRKKLSSDSNTHSKRVAKPRRQETGPIQDRPGISPKYVFVTDQNSTSGGKSKHQAKSYKEENCAGHNEKDKKLYEYGEFVDGYRLIGNKEQYDKWNAQNLKTDQTDDHMEANIDRFAFDGNLRTHRHFCISKDSYIMNYWKSDQSKLSALPILKISPSKESDPEEITRESVEQFYLRSCSLLDVELRALLKSERVFWHPDKMVGKMSKNDNIQLGKITKIFQIINDLWESL